MTDDQAPEWRSLRNIFEDLGRLDNPLHSAFPSKDERHDAVVRALLSGKVPVQGYRDAGLGLEPSERIEAKIDEQTEINVFLNEITLCKDYVGADGSIEARVEFVLFKRVQADKASVEQWLRNSALPAGGETLEAPKPAIVEAPKLPLPDAKLPELREFLDKLGPCSEPDARREAEAAFQAKITRAQIRANRSGKGKPGRPSKQRQEIPPRNPAEK